MLTRAAIAALCLSPLPGYAQEVSLTCTLSIICIEISACSDLDQEIAIAQEGGVWSVDWKAELPSDYEEIANIPAPEGALEPTGLRTLMHTNEETQAVQIISFADNGNLVLTLHQPHIRPQAVTGFGTCEAAAQ